MFRFLIKRLLIAIPVLMVVSVLAFFLALSAPGDIVEDRASINHELASSAGSYTVWKREYAQVAKRVGRDKPLFYFAILPSALSDTLYKITVKSERESALTWARRSGNWQLVDAYQGKLRSIISTYSQAAYDSAPGVHEVCNDIRYLLVTEDIGRSDYLWKSIVGELPVSQKEMSGDLAAAKKLYDNLQSEQPGVGMYIPKLVWYGFDNQYHHWVSSALSGDFGVSIVDGRPVGSKIQEAVGWTLRINLTAIFLAFGIAIPLGLATARLVGSRFDVITNHVLFIFFAIPSFWLATLFIVFFTTPEYANWLDLFPAGGIGDYHHAQGFKRIGIIIASLFLPVLSVSLGALAYLTKQMRGSALKEANKDYVRMARAKGLSEKQVFRNHIFKNALFPILTLIGATIPAAVSGSVIIEVLFGIPGMGRLLYDSILSQDWMVVFAMVVLGSVLTVIGYIVSDVLYYLADPRLRQQRKVS